MADETHLESDVAGPDPVAAADSSSGSRYRWRQISLRTLLLLMVSSSLFLAWYSRRLERLQRERSQIVATQWDVASGQNVKWSARLGSETYGNPVVVGDQVFIGTNNTAGYVTRFPVNMDMGVLLCFRKSDGQFLWQSSTPKLRTGRVHDWPLQGVCSTPLVEGDRLWYVTNRCEVKCLDTDGFHDGQNDGPFLSEANQNISEADVIWNFDMMGKLRVSPHNMSACSVVSAGNRLFVVTGNGVDETHTKLPFPHAPSFLCLDKNTGQVLWHDNSPAGNVLHGQWGSPAYGVLGGVPQVIFPGGDGWLYSFDPNGANGKSKLLWKFDCNSKSSKWILGGRGTRNNLLRAPVIYDQRIYMAVGQDPEHGEGAGRLWCIDPTRRGDVSPELVFNTSKPDEPIAHKRYLACEPDKGDFVRANPNSAVVWEFSGQDFDGDGKVDFEERMNRSLNSVAIKDGLLIAVDFSGLVHCLDADTGQRYWIYDLLANTWAAPLIAGEHVYVGDEDGDMAVFRLSSDPQVAMLLGSPHAEIMMPNSIYSTPVAANNVLYVATRNQLFAIEEKQKP